MSHILPAVEACLKAADRLWLFLDYDGTLADFAPTPDDVHPDAELVDLISRLAAHPRIRIAVVSGRRLDHVRCLVPVPGILLAGTYGIELQTPDGERMDRLTYDMVRPRLDTLKPQWARLLRGRQGFYLEDKGWSLAIHARFASGDEARAVLLQACALADQMVSTASTCSFRVLGGHRFLEVGPVLADKGKTVEYLLERYAWPNALPVYLGDDDKDEEAFDVIQRRGGIALVVSPEPVETSAQGRLASPQAARLWLASLPRHLDERAY